MNELPGFTACEAAQAEMNAYLDGELPAAEVAGIEDHLQQCAACRAEVELLRLVTRSLRLAARPEPPAAIRQRLLQQVVEELPPRRVDVLCIEQQGERVVRRQEVRLCREPARSLRPDGRPAMPGSGIVQQYRQEWFQAGNYCQTASQQYGRNLDERPA